MWSDFRKEGRARLPQPLECWFRPNALRKRQFDPQNTFTGPENHRVDPKTPKKVPIDSNTMFASIKTIKAAKDAQLASEAAWETKDRAVEARATSNVMLANEMAQFMTEFDVRSPVVE